MARVSFAALKRIAIALGWILLFFVVGAGITIGIAALVPAWGGLTWFVARTGVYELLGFGTATLVVGRLLSKHAWDAMGWRKAGLGRHILRGAGLGALMAAMAVGLAALLDHASVRLTGDFGQAPRVVLPLVFGLVCAALAEELAFRGYPLRRLAEAVGAAPAVVVFAVLFGLAHANNPSATPFSTLNVGLAAAWLSVAFFSAGGMGLAWGLHFGWNAGLAIAFDAPVSGYRFQVPGVDYAAGPRPWLDGGAFGPEGGLVATLVVLAGTAVLLGPRLKRPGARLTA